MRTGRITELPTLLFHNDSSSVFRQAHAVSSVVSRLRSASPVASCRRHFIVPTPSTQGTRTMLSYSTEVEECLCCASSSSLHVVSAGTLEAKLSYSVRAGPGLLTGWFSASLLRTSYYCIILYLTLVRLGVHRPITSCFHDASPPISTHPSFPRSTSPAASHRLLMISTVMTTAVPTTIRPL